MVVTRLVANGVHNNVSDGREEGIVYTIPANSEWMSSPALFLFLFHFQIPFFLLSPTIPPSVTCDAFVFVPKTLHQLLLLQQMQHTHLSVDEKNDPTDTEIKVE